MKDNTILIISDLFYNLLILRLDKMQKIAQIFCNLSTYSHTVEGFLWGFLIIKAINFSKIFYHKTTET